jgi:hypothetical protein
MPEEEALAIVAERRAKLPPPPEGFIDPMGADRVAAEAAAAGQG